VAIAEDVEKKRKERERIEKKRIEEEERIAEEERREIARERKKAEIWASTYQRVNAPPTPMQLQCEYCGTLNPPTPRCMECGAKLNPP